MRKNHLFYDKFPVGILNAEFAESAGLENAYELDISPLKNLVTKANSILEIGAGEGRIIDGLLKQNSTKTIYAVERATPFVKNLNLKYKSKDNVVILKRDVLQDELPKVDLGLHLWSGILEFSKSEQEELIKKLSIYCTTLVIDTPSISTKTNATQLMGQNLILKTDFGTVYGRIPTEKEFSDWSFNINKKIEKHKYITKNGRKRILYVLY